MTSQEPLDALTVTRLRDIARLCARAETLAARGRSWYDSDPELDVPKLAADSLVLKLGEAVRRLPDEFLVAPRVFKPDGHLRCLTRRSPSHYSRIQVRTSMTSRSTHR